MGFLDAIGPLVGAASTGMAGYLQGQQQARARQQQDLMTAIQLRRQQLMDADTQAMHAAQIKDFQSQAAERTANAAAKQQQTQHAIDTNRTDFKILKGRGLLPPGTTDDMMDAGNWSQIREDADKAKSAADLATLNNNVKKEIADAANNVKLGIANAQIGAANARETQREGAARGLEQLKAQLKAGAAGPGGGKPLSAQGMQALSRMGMSYNDLTQAIDQMDTFENDPKNLAKLSGLEQVKGQVAEFQPNPDTHSLLGIASNAVGGYLGAAAQRSLAKSDPEYRKYLLNKQRVGLAFTEILPRPNQMTLGLEKGISGVDAGSTPDIIANVQARRRGGLNVIKGILSGQGYVSPSGAFTPTVSGGGTGGATPSAAPSSDDPYAKAMAHARKLQGITP